MTTLSLHGGPRAVSGPLARFNTIGGDEMAAAVCTMTENPLSGYLGGELRGGKHVRALEEAWCQTFGVRHAVACNSATSGLLAACAAVHVGFDLDVITTPFTMSATVAAPAVLGANIRFADIDPMTFCLSGPFRPTQRTRAMIVTNLLGHPAMLRDTMVHSDRHDFWMIEDNAQSPFAQEHGRWAGTVGHIGVWSLNVHKHIQAGEGGICTTDDADLAERMRRFVNHGEMAGGRVGLNLRMTEVTAAIARAQLRKAPAIIAERIEIAEAITDQVRDLPGITPPVTREGCRHVFYCIAFKVSGDRKFIVDALRAEGVPIRAGYVDPLYRLPAFAQYAQPCPVAERMHDREMMLFENCAYTPTTAQIKQIGEAFKKVAEHAMESA